MSEKLVIWTVLLIWCAPKYLEKRTNYDWPAGLVCRNMHGRRKSRQSAAAGGGPCNDTRILHCLLDTTQVVTLQIPWQAIVYDAEFSGSYWLQTMKQAFKLAIYTISGDGDGRSLIELAFSLTCNICKVLCRGKKVS
jgi:hypothetical protein